MRRAVTTVAVLAVAVALVGACSGGGGKDASGKDGRASGAAAESSACKLLKTAEVTDLFGHTAKIVPGTAGPSAVASTCLWQAQVGASDAPTVYQLQLSVYEKGGTIDSAALGGVAEPVAGLGDAGFLVRKGSLGTTAAYRQGTRSVVLSYAILLSPDAPDSSAQADQVLDLLRDVHDRLD
jgi:hypothetical protein